jgi:hypothetical protein
VTDTRDEQAPWIPDPMIPGGRDPANLTHREPGAIGGQFSGGDIPSAPVPWLDETTAHERVREGGGTEGEHATRDRETRDHHAGAHRTRD